MTRGSSAVALCTPSPRSPYQIAAVLPNNSLMRGSEELEVAVPVMDAQSWDEEFWKVSETVEECLRSLNLSEWLLAKKRKSGPSRWKDEEETLDIVLEWGR